MDKIKGFIAVLIVALAVSGPSYAATLVIADFDTGDKPNNVGGDFGAWDKDPNDTTQGCKINFNPDTKHGDKGFAVQVDYDVDSPNPAYNGVWMKLNSADGTQYDKVTFWIKGDEVAGFSPKMKLELKNDKGEVGKYVVSNITKDWQEVSIPLSSFGGLTDKSSLSEFVIVFDDMTCAAKKQGTVYIDDIAFVK